MQQPEQPLSLLLAPIQPEPEPLKPAKQQGGGSKQEQATQEPELFPDVPRVPEEGYRARLGQECDCGVQALGATTCPWCGGRCRPPEQWPRALQRYWDNYRRKVADAEREEATGA
jgi:hypothetical protein